LDGRKKRLDIERKAFVSSGRMQDIMRKKGESVREGDVIENDKDTRVRRMAMMRLKELK
jgi:hypothetical protein